MDLWIRTQDDGLSHIVDILPVTDNKITAYSINGRCMYLGTYKTKERALEVLDDKQFLIDFMTCKNINKYDAEEFMQFSYEVLNKFKENGLIYEMPKE